MTFDVDERSAAAGHDVFARIVSEVMILIDDIDQ